MIGSRRVVMPPTTAVTSTGAVASTGPVAEGGAVFVTGSLVENREAPQRILFERVQSDDSSDAPPEAGDVAV